MNEQIKSPAATTQTGLKQKNICLYYITIKGAIMENYFKEIRKIETERERLIQEYKEAEYLYYTIDSAFIKDEAKLNMEDIQRKLDDLRFEEEQVKELMENMINQGVVI